MNIPQDDLDAMARLADGIRCGALDVVRLVMMGKSEEARDKATALHLDGANMLTKLHAVGAVLPSSFPRGEGTPLHLLDTPANRRLAETLREAHRAAQAVDEERGYDEPVLAQAVEDILAPVEMEVMGPAGLDS